MIELIIGWVSDVEAILWLFYVFYSQMLHFGSATVLYLASIVSPESSGHLIPFTLLT
jgi:hypothetical protein